MARTKTGVSMKGVSQAYPSATIIIKPVIVLLLLFLAV